MTFTGPLQHRLVIFTVSCVVIGLELCLMRELALRFWEHLGWLVISVALLGFGVSGTLLVLVHRFCTISRSYLQFASLLCLALSLPLCIRLADLIDLDLIQMIWQPAMAWQVGALELALGMPFVFAGVYIGLALQDRPEWVPGNYGASFLGSGAGGLATILLLYIFSPRQLILTGGCLILALALLHAQTHLSRFYWALSWAVMITLIATTSYSSKIAEDKDLPQIQAMQESTILTSKTTPQGLLTLVDAPALHLAPGLALTAPVEVAPQYPLLMDGQVAGALYHAENSSDFEFLDYTTMALPYHLATAQEVLVARDPGSDHTGLAVYHGAGRVTVLSTNAALNTLKLSETGDYKGYPYTTPEVQPKTATLRGFLHSFQNMFSLIVLPTVGTDPGGLSATQPESDFTAETIALCLNSITGNGLLAVSTTAHVPPRESLRLLNMLAEAIRKNGGEPRTRLAMIRNWSTVTLVAARKPFTQHQLETIRTFCTKRGFDLAWIPGLLDRQANIHHQLATPVYFHGAEKLLGPERESFIRNYLYDISAPDDNQPFFNSFGRWRGLHSLNEQLGKRGRAYVELGSFLLVAALAQALILSLLLVVTPLVPVVGLPGRGGEQQTVILFFSALGFGFMFLEMGLLQRLTTYLAHPLWAAAAVLSGVLIFGGVGATLSGHFRNRWQMRAIHFQAAVALIFTGVFLLLLINPILDATEKYATPLRGAMALVLIAPLAILMGMLFPMGIKRLSDNRPSLIPWAWALNGFASVLATLLSPLLAMQWGFLSVFICGLCCYTVAAFSSLGLPDPAGSGP